MLTIDHAIAYLVLFAIIIYLLVRQDKERNDFLNRLQAKSLNEYNYNKARTTQKAEKADPVEEHTKTWVQSEEGQWIHGDLRNSMAGRAHLKKIRKK